MGITRNTLKQVMLDNQKDVEQYDIFPRHYDLDSFPLMIFVGVRRSGKSFLLFQKMRQLLADGKGWDEMLYLDFEDTRLEGFSADDFNLILECHQEMYGKRPMLFLDEIQNVDGWQKFARNLADKKYNVFITGSNAKMLSKEIMADLGGRYLPVEVYPFSFSEFLSYSKVPFDELSLTATESKARFMKAFGEYFAWGGLPESINLPVKRNYLSSVFQKIYLGDIVQRNGVSNPRLLQLMIKKMAESVMQPVSYNRISKILSSVSGKISVPTVSSYVEYSEDAWLLLRLRNISSAFAENAGNAISIIADINREAAIRFVLILILIPSLAKTRIIIKLGLSFRPNFVVSLSIYAILPFASSASCANPSASFTAISASILRLISISASFRPYINLL